MAESTGVEPVSLLREPRGDGVPVISEPTNVGLNPLTIGGSSIYIPPSSTTDPSGVVHNDYSLMGPPIVDSDGSVYVEYQVRQLAYPPKVTSAVIYLLQIGPDGSQTTTQLMSNAQLNTSQYPEPTDSSLMPGRIIPDGQGGVLATWTISPSNPPFPPQPWHYYQAGHVVSNSLVATYDLPFLPFKPVLNRYPTMVLGENGTAFVTDGQDPDNGPQVFSFNLASGAPNWSYQASAGSTLSIIEATPGNGLTINDASVGVIHLDSGGNLPTGARARGSRLAGLSSFLQGAVPFDLSNWLSTATGELLPSGVPTAQTEFRHSWLNRFIQRLRETTRVKARLLFAKERMSTALLFRPAISRCLVTELCQM